LLIKEWNLSPDLEGAVQWHHRFEDPDATGTRLAAMIALGEEVAVCTSGNEVVVPEMKTAEPPEDSTEEESVSDAARFLGVSAEAMAELMTKAKELKIDPHFFN
jgi:hypothetical protein